MELKIIQRALTVYGEDVSLDDILVPLCVAGVIAGVLQLDPGQVEAAVTEHPHVLFVKGGQVQVIPPPNNRRYRGSRYVALDFDVVAHPGRQVVGFEGLVQGHDRDTYDNGYCVSNRRSERGT